MVSIPSHSHARRELAHTVVARLRLLSVGIQVPYAVRERWPMFGELVPKSGCDHFSALGSVTAFCTGTSLLSGWVLLWLCVNRLRLQKFPYLIPCMLPQGIDSRMEAVYLLFSALWTSEC